MDYTQHITRYMLRLDCAHTMLDAMHPTLPQIGDNVRLPRHIGDRFSGRKATVVGCFLAGKYEYAIVRMVDSFDRCDTTITHARATALETI